MFEDRRRALEQLEAELLKEETAEQEEALFSDGEDPLDDPDDFIGYFPEAYQNSCTHCHAYNTDRSDTDLEEYSEQVRQPRKNSGTLLLCAIALCLIAGILAVLAYWVIRFGG